VCFALTSRKKGEGKARFSLEAAREKERGNLRCLSHRGERRREKELFLLKLLPSKTKEQVEYLCGRLSLTKEGGREEETLSSSKKEGSFRIFCLTMSVNSSSKERKKKERRC